MSAVSDAVLSSARAVDAVLRAARRRLAQSPYVELRSVSCQHDGRRLVLRGVVYSYYQKQLAQETLANLAGLGDLHNDIRVRPRRTTAAVEPPHAAEGLGEVK